MPVNTVEIKEAGGYRLSVLRLTALWAFSESTLGGLLHIFRIPFTGFFIGGTAVLFISLIAMYSDQKSAILRSTMIVVIIKALVSPYTPLTAYFAVSVQGLLGYVLFYDKRFYEASALTLGILALVLSSLQKIIILTFLFGNSLWESIDLFAVHVMKQFVFNDISSFKLSRVLAGSYIMLHLIGGIIFGYIAGKLPRWIEARMNNAYDVDHSLLSEFALNRKNKKSFWKKPSVLILILFFTTLLLISFTDESFGKDETSKILVMIIRSIIVMLLWFFFVSPLLMIVFNKIIRRRMRKYSDEINEIINVFPYFRHILGISWKRSSQYNGLKKITQFFSYSFILLLLSGIDTQ